MCYPTVGAIEYSLEGNELSGFLLWKHTHIYIRTLIQVHITDNFQMTTIWRFKEFICNFLTIYNFTDNTTVNYVKIVVWFSGH